jgi:hypothetical protein
MDIGVFSSRSRPMSCCAQNILVPGGVQQPLAAWGRSRITHPSSEAYANSTLSTHKYQFPWLTLRSYRLDSCSVDVSTCSLSLYSAIKFSLIRPMSAALPHSVSYQAVTMSRHDLAILAKDPSRIEPYLLSKIGNSRLHTERTASTEHNKFHQLE